MDASAGAICRLLVVVAGASAAMAAGAQGFDEYLNVTEGGVLRPGVYGRIEPLRGKAAAPPVISPQPVVARAGIDRVQGKPLYLYVPPGHVRNWLQHCARWSACDQPVLFVRMEQSPSRWGEWRHRREQLASSRRTAP
jgi:hypothetical protein